MLINRKNLSRLVILLCFCLTVGVNQSNLAFYFGQSKYDFSKKQEYYLHAFRLESFDSVSNLGKLVNQIAKKILSDKSFQSEYLSLQRVLDLVFRNAFFTLRKNNPHGISSLKSTDIIYPFHYFW